MYELDVSDLAVEEVFDSPPPSLDALDLSVEIRSLIEEENPGQSGLPTGLVAMAPSPALAAFLSVVDPAVLSGFDQVNLVGALQKTISYFQARYYSTVSALADSMSEFEDDPEMAMTAASMELRAALRLTRRMADMELDLAYEITHRLPQVVEALESGSIDVRRAKVLANGTIHLGQADARKVVDEVVDRAGQLTTGELASRVRKLCVQVAPEHAEEEFKTAHEERRMVVDPTVSGTADLHILGARPDQATRAADRINQLAKSLHSPGETRTMDQLRADIAIDLLCGTPASQPNHTTSKVTVHVDLDTLARLTEMPGELGGYGPVIADIARQTAEQTAQQTRSQWRFRVTDPDTGQPVAAGITRKRRHNAHQRRQVELRDPVCVFPGCRTPSTSCDIDHIEDWADTHQTSTEGSAPLDRADHTGKHRYGWKYRRLPNGDYLWKSRLGHLYTKSGRPPPRE